MEKMVKIGRSVCSKCQYRARFGQILGCNYLGIEGHSRIFQDKQPAYNPKYCDKFKEGEQIVPRVDAIYYSREYDEYEDYKFVKIRKEKSSYEYKYRERTSKRNN